MIPFMSRFTLFKQIPRSDFFFVAVLSLLCFGLFFIDNELRPSNDEDSERVKVEILEVDNSNLEQSGIIQTGIQDLELEILSGTFRGKRLHSENQLMGRLEFDKIFVEGDKALAVLTLSPSHDEIRLIHVIDHYRLNTELILVLLFAGFLIYYARWVGIKSILSFLFTGLVIWKILLPGFLLGYHPVLLSIGVVCVLTCVIVFLVAGWNRKGFVAFSGAMTGVLLTCFMALFFDVFFQVHGAVKPFSETLLYSGYSNLNLTDIFLAGIFISSSGAVMDIAMDIAASQHEVLLQNPEISRKNWCARALRWGVPWLEP